MERIDAIHDLLERTVGDDASENGVGGQEVGILRNERGAAAHRRDERLVWEDGGARAPSGERARELIGVPSGACGEDGDEHRPQVSWPTRAENPPVAKLGKSPATAAKPGVAVPRVRAASESNQSSALR